MNLDLLLRIVPLLCALLGLAAPLLAWWTSHRGQRSQATKAELDSLLAAVAQSQDGPYRDFLLEIHKEKLVGMTTGCVVPRAEIHKMMECYRHAKYTPHQIRLIWPHRDRKSGQFRIRLEWPDLVQLWLSAAYLLLCFIGIILAAIVIVFTHGPVQWFYLVVELIFGGLFLFTIMQNEGIWVSYRLSRSEDA